MRRGHSHWRKAYASNVGAHVRIVKNNNDGGAVAEDGVRKSASLAYQACTAPSNRAVEKAPPRIRRLCAAPFFFHRMLPISRPRWHSVSASYPRLFTTGPDTMRPSGELAASELSMAVDAIKEDALQLTRRACGPAPSRSGESDYTCGVLAGAKNTR